MKSAPLPAREDERLRILHELRFGESETDAALQALARLASSHTGWPIGAISLVDAQRQWFPAAVGLSETETPRAFAFCAHTILGEDTLVVHDARQDDRFAGNPLVLEAPHVRAYAGRPVIVEGQRIGTVCAIDPRQPNRLEADGLAALADLATLAGHLLEARLRAQRSRLQEARVRSASRAGSDWLWESSADGVMTWVSDSVEAHAGQAPHAEVGQHARQIVRPHPQHRPSWDAYVAARAAHRPFKDVIAERQTPRGVISISFSGEPVFDTAGRLQGYRGATRNVTRELALRAQAERAQALLQGAMEHIPAALMISDPQGRIVLSNKIWRHNTAPFITEGRSETWEALLREMVTRGAYPEAAGREEAFIAWRLAVVQEPARRHEMRFGDLYVLMTDQRLADGSVVHLSVDITARKRAELALAEQGAQLRASEARLRAVLQSVPDLWFVIDAELRCLACSHERHPWLSRPFEQLRGQGFAEAGPNPPPLPLADAIGQAQRSGEVQRLEYEAAIADGSRRDVEARVSPMEGGQALVLLRDLTELRTLERHVQLLQRALETEGALPMIIVDASRREMPLSYCNAAFERLTGYSAAEVIGRNCRLLQGGDHEQPGLAVLRQAVARGEAATVVLNNVRKDGSAFANELHVAPVRDRNGSLTHYIGVLNDVTERSRAERALEQSEARWNFALDGAGYGVWDHDEDSGTVFFSRRWKEMLGYAEGEIGDRLQEWTRRIHPQDHPRVMDAIARHRQGETAEYETQHRLRHKDGHWIWVLDRAKIVERRADGSPRRVVGTHSDITRQKLADQALRDRQASELASRAKSEFLSRMSHEMRTPLNAVIGFTQLLRLHGGADAQRLGQYSEHILQAAQHLLALVNDVLDLQQVEEGRLSLQLAALSLNEAVEAALDMVRPSADRRALRIDSRVEPGVRVRADAQRLRQVLLNVLSNAVKYNRDGGTVRCRLQAAGSERCALLIEDDGSGLTAQQVARLFQPFERLGLETSSVEGSGLGLIISRRLMEGMQGSLSLTSQPGAGTRVRLELPLAAVDAGDGLQDPARPTASPAGAPAPATGPASTPAPAPLPAPARVRMLYVEDNRVNAILFEEAIKLRGGIELRVAEDGDEGLALAVQWQPHVLVLDANLPGMTGYEVLAALRRQPGLARTPAFMCSADAMPEDLERARRAGFSGYWTKPIDIARVMSDLDTLRLNPCG